MLSALGRATLGLIVGLALAAAAGATYETVAGSSDHLAYRPAGRLIDMGGYSMHIDCRGEGSPTVVMDAGLGGSSLDWSLVQPEVASTTRVCSYDRAGMGWSEVGPLPRTPGSIAEELHQLLYRAGVSGPFILVGHSLAGKTIRMFAAAHPADVAGMVLVDARSEYVDALTPEADQDAFAVALDLQGTVYSAARRLGVARLFGAGLVGVPLLPPSVATEIALLQTLPTAIEETTREGTSRAADDTSLAAATLGSTPLVVVASASSMAEIPNWSMAQHRLAALSTRGELIVAESGHAVHLEQPRLVIDGISRVLAEIRHP
jgi:pimeloyl-ACP methyl ester carboxylesterase